MPTLTVTVQPHVVGATPADILPGPVALELLSERLTAAELIAHAVEEQIRELTLVRRLKTAAAQEVLDRQYLTANEVSQQAARGAVRFPSLRAQQIDVQAAIAKAQSAFASGLFILLIDGEQIDSLSEHITLTPASKITFLRLTPLVGG